VTADTTTLESFATDANDASSPERCDALVVVWCRDEPSRLGEVLLVPHGGGTSSAAVFGRGVDDDPRGQRVTLARQRPGENIATAPLDTPHLSRVQLVLRTAEGEGCLDIENKGKRALLIAGREVPSGHVRCGDLVEVGGQILFLCTRRPRTLPAMRAAAAGLPGVFGEADAFGYVGESPAAWRLRDEIALVSSRREHVLVLGESGSGKELVAQALHTMSPRAGRKLVARNAATVPAGLIDAEFFGNAANYPSSGMPERPGLVGEAEASTLYLDELGELPAELQTHLLRLLDGGDYQRLGDSKKRTADVRVVAATNRPVGQLRGDLAARFPIHLHAPGLHERREDIPLLARHLLHAITASGRGASSLVTAHPSRASGTPEITKELTAALVQHLYATHTRELTHVLFRALLDDGGRSPVVHLTRGAMELLAATKAEPEPNAPRASEVTREALEAALARQGGVRERVWRELGLANRYVLKRLLKKHGLGGAGGSDGEDE
jgi:DNA-binding NtrC family response regulator